MASLENRGNGSWRVTISAGYKPNGQKNFRKRTFKVDPTKTENAQRAEVKKLAAALETDFDRHLINPGNKVSINELADEFMDEHVRRTAAG